MPASSATILLCRHGHVEGLDPPRFRGRQDLALTTRGEDQARCLRERIARQWQPAAVVASPLQRTLRTGAIVADAFGCPVEPVDDLIDLDYGAWQGLLKDDVRGRWPRQWASWQATPELAMIPDGETLQALAARVLRALHQLACRHRGGSMVVVAHDSVNRVALLHALDLPLSRYATITQAPCTLNVLVHDDHRLRVTTLNETGHLPRMAGGSDMARH